MKKNFNDIEVNDMIVCKTLSGIEYVMTVTSISENKVFGTGRTPEETKYIKEVLGGTYECVESDFIRFYHPHKMILPVSYLVNGYIDFDAETMEDAMQQFESMRYSEILSEKINIEKDIDDKSINEKSLMIPVPAEGPAMYNPEYVNYLFKKANDIYRYYGCNSYWLVAKTKNPNLTVSSIAIQKKDGTSFIIPKKEFAIDDDDYDETGEITIFMSSNVNTYEWLSEPEDIDMIFVKSNDISLQPINFHWTHNADDKEVDCNKIINIAI